MHPEPRPYITALRRELLALSTDRDPVEAGGLRYCTDHIVSQLIVREYDLSGLVDALQDQLSAAAAAASDPMDAERRASLLAAFDPAPDGDRSAAGRRRLLLDALEDLLDALPENGPERAQLERAASAAEEEFRAGFLRAAAGVAEELAAEEESGGWSLTPDEVASGIAQLRPDWGEPTVTDLRPVAGVHAKEIWFAELASEGGPDSLVIRRDREEDLTRASVAAEFPLLEALHDRGFPLPEPLAVAADPEVFGRPAVLMRLAPGDEHTLETIPDATLVLDQAAEILARLHNTPAEGTGLPGADTSDVAALWLDRIGAHWDWWSEVASEPAVVVRRARRWLQHNVELAAGAAVVVHGDFSLRNLLIDDSGIAAVLDWELAHIGHPAEDLGYLRLTVESVMEWKDFERRYTEAGGIETTIEQIRYFDIWGLFRNAAINATAQHVFTAGESQDYFFGTAAITEYPKILTGLTRALDEVDR